MSCNEDREGWIIAPRAILRYTLIVEFRWNAWNLDHATKHGVSREEAERIVENARPPDPEERGDDKWRVVGRGQGDRWVQVIFLVDDDGSIYVIHARPLTDHEKRRHRRRMR